MFEAVGVVYFKDSRKLFALEFARDWFKDDICGGAKVGSKYFARTLRVWLNQSDRFLFPCYASYFLVAMGLNESRVRSNIHVTRFESFVNKCITINEICSFVRNVSQVRIDNNLLWLLNLIQIYISSDKSVEKAARHMIVNNFLEKKKKKKINSKFVFKLSERESCNNCN